MRRTPIVLAVLLAVAPVVPSSAAAVTGSCAFSVVGSDGVVTRGEATSTSVSAAVEVTCLVTGTSATLATVQTPASATARFVGVHRVPDAAAGLVTVCGVVVVHHRDLTTVTLTLPCTRTPSP